MSTTISTGDSTERTDPGSWWQRHGRRVSLVVRFALILSVVVGATWWYLFAPVVVTTHTVATGTVSAEVMGTGTLEARTSASVGPKIGGLILSIAADQGDRVKAGTLLFQLEDSDFRQQVKMAAIRGRGGDGNPGSAGCHSASGGGGARSGEDEPQAN
jgi:multidrug resistance efflux pump